MEHFVSESCKGEKCRICKSPATHLVSEKITSDNPNSLRSNLIAYVCCEHFRMILGPAVACSQPVRSLKKYAILEPIVLGFLTPQDQYDTTLHPGRGIILESDGNTIWTRQTSTTVGQAIQAWLKQGKIQEIKD